MKLGSRPALFWQPWLGHYFGLRPSDLADIFILDYVQMWLDIRQMNERR